LTIASIGGPLALAALYFPSTLDGAASSAGLVTLMGSLVFLFPLLIWLRYSERIASNGGLYAFVEAAAGAPVARVQAIFWIISYFLYLVYTVPFIVYDLLPVVVPQVSRYQLLLDAGLAVTVAGVMLSPKIVAFSVMALWALSSLEPERPRLCTSAPACHCSWPAKFAVGRAPYGAPWDGRLRALQRSRSSPFFRSPVRAPPSSVATSRAFLSPRLPLDASAPC
jgi:hypothetical protein